MKPLDPRSPEVFKLCERFAERITRNSLRAKGFKMSDKWTVSRNPGGYPVIERTRHDL